MSSPSLARQTTAAPIALERPSIRRLRHWDGLGRDGTLTRPAHGRGHLVSGDLTMLGLVVGDEVVECA